MRIKQKPQEKSEKKKKMLMLRKRRPTIRQQKKKEAVQLIMDNRHRAGVISVNGTLFWIWLDRSLMFTK